MDDVVNDFLAESHENLERLDRAFLTLEQDPTAAEVLADVFRTIHTIKGTCGFLGFKKLERLSHGGESLLARVRDGEKSFDAQISQALFELVDAVRAILSAVESTGDEGAESYESLTEELLALCADEPAPARPDVRASAMEPETGRVHAPTRRDASIRVDVEQLDQLMDLVGELVLSRNQIQSHADASVHTGLRASSHRLAQITSDLQDGVMRTRLQPIGSAWSKVPRLLRDLCAQLDKRARFEASGAQTPIDRGILEMLRDPLTHMVRNSIDHGIEAPALRVQRGKPAEGILQVRAWAAGGRVHLSVEDDGAGIDPACVRRKALERGVIDAEQAARMGDAEAIQLIFHPGFSTAGKVTELSGRGVGMDVVKTNIERLGGSVSVSSRPGVGTRIELSIPLTLAIFSVVMVECVGLRFALPEISVHGLVRIPRAGEPGAALRVQGASVLPLHGALLPLIELRDVLELNRGAPAPADPHAVVLESDGRRFGLVVDALHDIEEIVVKPLGPVLGRIGVYSGATILGDGRVALILDVFGLAERGKLDRTAGPVRVQAASQERAQAARQLLLLDVSDCGRVAIDLARVLRLESVPLRQIEHSFGHPLLRWRDDVIPLGFLRTHLGGSAPASNDVDSADDSVHVVICDIEGRRLGLVAASIVDVTDEPLQACDGVFPRHVRERGLLCGAVTNVLDLDTIARELFLEHSSAGARP